MHRDRSFPAIEADRQGSETASSGAHAKCGGKNWNRPECHGLTRNAVAMGPSPDNDRVLQGILQEREARLAVTKTGIRYARPASGDREARSARSEVATRYDAPSGNRGVCVFRSFVNPWPGVRDCRSLLLAADDVAGADDRDL